MAGSIPLKRVATSDEIANAIVWMCSDKSSYLTGVCLPVDAAIREPVHVLFRQALVAQPVVNKIGPWDKQRLPPPKAGNVRMTFLVSDGLYFGEGPFAVLQQDSLAGPVLSKATQLLLRAVELGTK